MEENRFINASREGKNNFWRYLLGAAFVGFAFLGGGFCSLGVIFLATGSIDLLSLAPQISLAVNLAPFFFVLIGLGVALPLLHKRRFFSLINPMGRFAWQRFFLSAGLWFLVSLAADVALAVLQPGNYLFAFEPARFVPWLLVAVLLLPFQCAAEELLFRAYLTQWLGLIGGYWLAWLAPGALFGVLHGANPEVGAYGMFYTLPMYIGTGLLLGWITLRSESLELALGLHTANNLYGAVLVTFPSSVLPAPALFRIQTYHPEAALIAFLAAAGLYLILLSALGRIFFRKRAEKVQER